MARFLSLTLALALVASLPPTAPAPVAAAPLPAAKNGLSQIPATAPMVIQMRGLEGSVDRIIAFLKNAVPDYADLAALFIRSGLQNGADGRTFKALAKDGPHFVAFLEMPKPEADGLPKMAIIVSTTDNKKFLDGILKESERKALKKEEGYSSTVMEPNGDPLFIVEREGYVILSPRKDAAQEMLKKGAGIDGKISDELTEKLLAFDLGVYLSMDVFNKDYAEQIKVAKKEAIAAIKDQAENSGLDKAQLVVAKQMVEGMFQATEDSKGIVLGLEFRPTALAFHFQTEVRPNTATAKALADVKTSKFEDLGKMTGGQMFYIAGEMNGTLLDAMKGSLFGQAGDPDSKEAKAIGEALDKLVKSKPTTLVQSSTAPVAGLQVWQVEEPKTLVAAQIELFKAMGEGSAFGGVIIKGKPTVKENAQKYRNISFSQTNIKVDLDKVAAQFGGDLPEDFKKTMAEGMKKLIGEEMSIFHGIDGKAVVSVTAKDWAAAEKMLESYYEGKGTIKLLDGYAQMRKELPGQGTVFVLVDMPTYVAAIVDLIRPLLEMQINLPQKFPADAPKNSAGYIGFAATMNKDRASADAVISAECINVIYRRFVAPFLRGAE